MNRIVVGKENSADIGLYYEDLGEGQPVVLIHGYPLSSRSFEHQLFGFLNRGYRVISYDRRGFGRSVRPSSGYDYDTLASDLNEVLTQLDLKDVILVGFSMGGGEIARYIGTYGTERLSKVAFISAVTPYLLKGRDNPEGVERKVFADLENGIRKDRFAFLKTFFKQFYNLDAAFGLAHLLGDRISDELVQDSWNEGAAASPIATFECVKAWGEDFRADLARCDVPTLVLHGDADQIVPIDASARRMKQFIPHAVTVEIPGAPHGMLASHYHEVDTALFDFVLADKTINIDARRQAGIQRGLI